MIRSERIRLQKLLVVQNQLYSVRLRWLSALAPLRVLNVDGTGEFDDMNQLQPYGAQVAGWWVWADLDEGRDAGDEPTGLQARSYGF